MENYVTSREWADKLREKGYPQDSTVYLDLNGELFAPSNKITKNHYLNSERDVVARPISDELLELLPKYIKQHYLAVIAYGDKFEAAYEPAGNGGLWLISKSSDKPADALAQLWIWAVDNGYIQPEGGK